eukprot:TRINITY_DN5242_c0_g1_i2.p1 TRINITY_DN5242_c0_g1~~TRINITY_DN5242_c0_g1_i2.p1  ORF type:complete len:236 (-),score=51.32 TRINITY_DN5242_c0_g1_i2:61-768(-)
MQAMERTDAQVDEMLNEISLLAKLHHSSIVSYISSCFVGKHLVIIMEYVAGGTLMQTILDFNGLSPSAASCYGRDIIRGLAYLHQHSILHRDIKPQNCLVQQSGVCKLADFGTSGQHNDGGLIGTLMYMSPEAMCGQWLKAGDVWSFGVTFHQMFTCESPFSDEPGPIVFGKEPRRRTLKDLSPLPSNAAHLLRRCLAHDPADRSTAREVRLDPFFRDDLDASCPFTNGTPRAMV